MDEFQKKHELGLKLSRGKTIIWRDEKWIAISK
jgi:hypothetical protein